MDKLAIQTIKKTVTNQYGQKYTYEYKQLPIVLTNGQRKKNVDLVDKAKKFIEKKFKIKLDYLEFVLWISRKILDKKFCFQETK